MNCRSFPAWAGVILLSCATVLVGCGSDDAKNAAAERASSTVPQVADATSTSVSSGGGASPSDETGSPGTSGPALDQSPAPGGTDTAGAAAPSGQSKSFSIDSDGNVTEGPPVASTTYSAPEVDQRLAAAGDDYCSLAGLVDDLLGYGDVDSASQAHLNLTNAQAHRRLIPHHPELAVDLESVAAALSSGDPIDAYRANLQRVVEVDSKIFAVSDERCGQ